ncbi:MAG TPA: bifunctional NAD(P)/FAD-dependent oxidoreductase/class I SAM-dependent methyltransferase [Microthrixaceae bacterium]|nr:bifunctional NAD(P)/FAD-dependent oxidoreductase/class I SAM-dependent methyltransferase [Microthrixaceae bacterium]
MNDHASHAASHTPHSFERHCDVAVIGGSAAGLAAALQLGRQRRSVIVVDAGEPRNAPATHMHSYLGHDGLPPSELAELGREEVRSYGVEVVPGRAIDITRLADGDLFRINLAEGTTVVARRIVAATGVVDELPDIEGLSQHWGTDVIACPFCHGYEVRDQRIVQIVTDPMGLHPAALFRHLSEKFTMILHDGVEVSDTQIELLRAGGVTIIDERVRRVVTGSEGRLVAVELMSGAVVDADAVVITTRFTPRVDAFATLGLEPTAHPSGLGYFIETDEMGATALPGLFAAGNVTDPSQQVLQAAAAGSRVGALISSGLAHDDIESASRPSANEADWDHRYSGEQIWSGNPNGALVSEVADLPVGRALDVGAGEGGDVIWLAEQGWKVTASDVSQRALDRIESVATKRSLALEFRHIDANAPDAFAGDQFDLVSAHYASIPRTPDDRGIRNLTTAVAPGGLLLVVGHDLEPMRTQIDTRQHSRAFDPDAYVRVEDIADALANSSEWKIEVHERRARPSGAASGGQHVDDVVLRARRRV